MPNIPFPDVPELPGVPAIPRSPNFPPTIAAGLGLLQGALWRSFEIKSQWGIYDSKGKALGDPANITGLAGFALDTLGLGSTLSTNSFDYSKETRVSDFPIERGSFANYNKVETPATPTVSLCLTGSEADRRKFLDAIDKATKSTELYKIVTPEVNYIDYSIERYNYQRRNNKGVTLLIVELSLKEIRQVDATYTKSITPKQASAVPAANNGKVQPKVPQTSTLKKLADKLPVLINDVKVYLQGIF